jgi:hypothetical protein
MSRVIVSSVPLMVLVLTTLVGGILTEEVPVSASVAVVSPVSVLEDTIGTRPGSAVSVSTAVPSSVDVTTVMVGARSVVVLVAVVDSLPARAQYFRGARVGLPFSVDRSGPKKIASVSESGMAFCAYAMSAIATHNKTTTRVMKGHLNAEGL